ncbi:MAG: phosphatidate cytidylyltransferase [Candidatus Gastranaerophilales bacterium]|nr:phosphatidate cytidylyltransferase [Candidatus Gastranaerophilales bacterium]
MGLIKFFSGARVYVATIFLSITLICIILGGPYLMAFLAVLMVTGTLELIKFARLKGMDPSVKIILLTEALLLLAAGLHKYYYFGLIITFGVITSFITILFRGKKAKINDLAFTILGFLYGGWLPMHILLLRSLNIDGLNFFGLHFKDGLGYIIMIFLVITISDIAGYYIGKNFGKTPLWPEVSPKKTLKGSVASTTGGIIAALIVGYFINLPWYHSFAAGTLLVLSAQIGDLCESMMKRDAGVKDSGNILPGHGGVLDRADSYIFTGAVAYYYFSVFVIGHYSLISMLPF